MIPLRYSQMSGKRLFLFSCDTLCMVKAWQEKRLLQCGGLPALSNHAPV